MPLRREWGPHLYPSPHCQQALSRQVAAGAAPRETGAAPGVRRYAARPRGVAGVDLEIAELALPRAAAFEAAHEQLGGRITGGSRRHRRDAKEGGWRRWLGR